MRLQIKPPRIVKHLVVVKVRCLPHMRDRAGPGSTVSRPGGAEHSCHERDTTRAVAARHDGLARRVEHGFGGVVPGHHTELGDKVGTGEE